jgi:hypothetical protein
MEALSPRGAARWITTLVVVATTSSLAGCPREQARSRAPAATPQPELPADASIRLINDPLPAQPPDGSNPAAPPMIPLGPR